VGSRSNIVGEINKYHCKPRNFWDRQANVFPFCSDVLGKSSDIDIYVYDHSNQEAFLGHLRISPQLEDDSKIEGWYKLESREGQEEKVTGEIFLQMRFQKTDKKHYGPEDFQILKLIGKGV
jgi:protein-serine/threonine kinase